MSRRRPLCMSCYREGAGAGAPASQQGRYGRGFRSFERVQDRLDDRDRRERDAPTLFTRGGVEYIDDFDTRRY